MQGYKREVFPGDALHKWKRVDLRRPASWPAVCAVAVMCQVAKDCDLPENPQRITAGWAENYNRALYFRNGIGGGLQSVSNAKRNNDIWFCMAPTPHKYLALGDPRTWPKDGEPVILRLEAKDGVTLPKYAAGHFEKQQTRTLWWISDWGNWAAKDMTRNYYVTWEYLPKFDGAPYAGQG